MAKLYLKQKVFSWGDKFNVYNEFGEAIYHVKGEVFTLGKKLHVSDPKERELAFIHQKVWSFKSRYFISRDGNDIAEVVKEITFLKAKYTVEAFGWLIQGKILDHEYQITRGEQIVAKISHKWLSWGDTYEIDIANGEDVINVLCAVLIIDAVKASQAAAAAASST